MDGDSVVSQPSEGTRKDGGTRQFSGLAQVKQTDILKQKVLFHHRNLPVYSWNGGFFLPRIPIPELYYLYRTFAEGLAPLEQGSAEQ